MICFAVSTLDFPVQRYMCKHFQLPISDQLSSSIVFWPYRLILMINRQVISVLPMAHKNGSVQRVPKPRRSRRSSGYYPSSPSLDRTLKASLDLSRTNHTCIFESQTWIETNSDMCLNKNGKHLQDEFKILIRNFLQFSPSLVWQFMTAPLPWLSGRLANLSRVVEF